MTTQPSPPARHSIHSGPELVIGLVTPIGTSAGTVAERIRIAFSHWNYTSYIIKLSSYLDIPAAPEQPTEYEDVRILRLIDAGNDRCHASNDRSAVAKVGMSAIVKHRVDRLREVDPTLANASVDDLVLPLSDRTVYILQSLKRVDEVKMLQSAYGPQFVLVGCQASAEERRANLYNQYLSDPTPSGREQLVTNLMRQDAKQEDVDSSEKFGQNVNDTYALADYFLGIDEDASRLVRILFGDPAVAVEPAEQAMYAAYMASGTSLSPSRKVGAALVRAGSLTAIGSNDVPKAEMPDVEREVDFSEQLKRRIVADAVARVRQLPGGEGLNANDLEAAIGESSVSSIIEGQRAVHAEAAAMSDAARRGLSSVDCELFTTTFPCHLCFKLAIDMGIARIRYIIPYPKSRAREMFPESTSLLQPYEGVAPSFYAHAFIKRMPPKFDPETNQYQAIDRATAQPWLENKLEDSDIADTEQTIVEKLEDLENDESDREAANQSEHGGPA